MKILIIRFSSLGDIILTFPVLENIKLNDRNIEVYYLTKKQYALLVKKNRNVDYVFEFSSFLKTLFEVRKHKFDLVIDLHSNLRSFLFRTLINAKDKIKYHKDWIYRRLFVSFKILSPRLEKHVVEKYLETIEKLGFKIIKKELNIKDVEFGEAKINNPQKILIIQTAFIGDLILTLPMIKEIKSKFKDAKISVLVRKDLLNMINGVKEIDEIIADEKKERNFITEIIRLIRLIRSRKFDIAIIPHRSLRSAILAFMSGIKIRIGFDIKPFSFLYTHKLPFNWLFHDVDRNLLLASTLINIKENSFPEIEASINEEKFKKLQGIKPLIVINPSSIWKTKRWPYYKYGLLIRRIFDEYKVPVVLTGSQKEKEYIENIVRFSGEDKVIDLSGQTTLDELIGIVKNAFLVITNDSGPMHIAVAVNVWVVAIFGPTTKELGFFPYSSKSVVIEKEISCRPCRLHGSERCPRGHFLCMNTIKVEDVMKEVEKILKYNI